jgi:hypothetical protein
MLTPEQEYEKAQEIVLALAVIVKAIPAPAVTQFNAEWDEINNHADQAWDLARKFRDKLAA